MTESRKPILLLIDSRPQELHALQERLGDIDLVCQQAPCGDEAMAVLQDEACFSGIDLPRSTRLLSSGDSGLVVSA